MTGLRMGIHGYESKKSSIKLKNVVAERILQVQKHNNKLLGPKIFNKIALQVIFYLLWWRFQSSISHDQ